MPQPHPLPCNPGAEREVGSGCVQMVLALDHAQTVGAKRGSLLAVPPLLRLTS
jgi:hypothetical protein